MLKRAEAENCGFDATHPPSLDGLARLTLPEEREMLKKISAMQDVVRGAAAACEPHRLIYFYKSLSLSFTATLPVTKKQNGSSLRTKINFGAFVFGGSR